MKKHLLFFTLVISLPFALYGKKEFITYTPDRLKEIGRNSPPPTAVLPLKTLAFISFIKSNFSSSNS